MFAGNMVQKFYDFNFFVHLLISSLDHMCSNCIHVFINTLDLMYYPFILLYSIILSMPSTLSYLFLEEHKQLHTRLQNILLNYDDALLHNQLCMNELHTMCKKKPQKTPQILQTTLKGIGASLLYLPLCEYICSNLSRV